MPTAPTTSASRPKARAKAARKPATGKATGVHFVDAVTKKDYTAKAKVVIVAASTLESARLLLPRTSGFAQPDGLDSRSPELRRVALSRRSRTLAPAG